MRRGVDGEHAPGTGSGLAAMAGRLTARDRWLLRVLHEHTVLTTTQLHRLGWGTGLRQVQGRVRVLRAHDVVDGFQPLRAYGHGSHPMHLVLGPVGAQVLAAEAGTTVSGIGYRGRARALGVAHRLTLAHDVAVIDLVTDLVSTGTTPSTGPAPSISPAGEGGGVEVVRWWSARRCARYFGHHARPDAYLAVVTRPRHTMPGAPGVSGAPGRGPGAGVGMGWWEMFLEFDTGTESLAQLAGKLAGYHALAEDSGVVTPLGFWFTRAGREPTARRALADAQRALSVPDRVPILTGTPNPNSALTPGPIHAARPTHRHRPGRDVDDPTGLMDRAGPGGAGARMWLALHPGAAERVDLATLARVRPRRALPPTPDPELTPEAGVGRIGRSAAQVMWFPAPLPYPPTTGEAHRRSSDPSPDRRALGTRGGKRR